MHCENLMKNIFISKEEIAQRVSEMGKQITEDFKGKSLLAVCVLKGAWIFTADLLRNIDLDVDVDFICMSSYGNGVTSSGNVKILKDLSRDCANRDVLIIEDIIDSGITLSNLRKLLLSRNAKSVTITTLLSKPSRRTLDVDVKYVGFSVPDKFVVGYGMDYAERFRELPDIYVLKEEAYKK